MNEAEAESGYDPARHGLHKPDVRGFCNAAYVCGRWPCDFVDLIDQRDASEREVAQLQDAAHALGLVSVELAVAADRFHAFAAMRIDTGSLDGNVAMGEHEARTPGGSGIWCCERHWVESMHQQVQDALAHFAEAVAVENGD